MPVSFSLEEIRDLLLPGLYEVMSIPRLRQWDRVFADVYIPPKPHIWIPKLTLPQTVAVGAAAAVIKNPVVSRRFWQGWSI